MYFINKLMNLYERSNYLYWTRNHDIEDRDRTWNKVESYMCYQFDAKLTVQVLWWQLGSNYLLIVS